MQKHRIYTNLGKEQVINVEINQDFSLLEILSLKLTQKDVYTTLCSDYGVVCGRVSINNGFGLPNARISIFIPLNEDDEDDPVISALYPYKSIGDISEEGFRYNLLPARRQHGGHEPTGTFPDQLDILSREEVLEVYEKYYKYTVKTNTSGDFMIWGVPVGEQTLHVDIDLSDIGCFSLRPDDFLRKGYGIDEFKTSYQFTSSPDIDSLPQIKTFDKSIEVFPFWGSEDLCEIGITRADFDLSSIGVKIEPKAYIIGGFFSDTEKNSINKNCMPRVKMGRKCDLVSPKATIEMIRFTHHRDENNNPILEFLNKNEDIDNSGAFVLPIEMNMDYVYTNEFGENEYTNDPNRGIPTSGVYRFRATVKNEELGRVRATASYLLPNIKEYKDNSPGHDPVNDKSYAWSTDLSDYPEQAIEEIVNKIDGFYYPEDYFYRFTYNKVYTVSSFQNMYYNKDKLFRRTVSKFLPLKPRFLGIKEIVPTEEEDCSDSVNTFPVNFGVKNYTFNLFVVDVLLFIEHLINLVTLTFINAVCKAFFSLSEWLDSLEIFRKLSIYFSKVGYRTQENGQRFLYLINYPECEECNDEEFNKFGQNVGGDSTSRKLSEIYCSIGTVKIYPNITDEEPGGYSNATEFTWIETTIGDCPIVSMTTDSFIGGEQQYYQIYNTEYDMLCELDTNFSKDGENIKFQDTCLMFEEFFDIISISPTSLIFDILSKTNKIDNDFTDDNTDDSLITEDGCELYDTPYDDDIIYGYYTTETWNMNTVPKYQDNHPCGCPQTYIPGIDNIIATNITDRNCTPSLDHWFTKKRGIEHRTFYYWSCGNNPTKLFPLVKSYGDETYEPITQSGMSEFKDGVFKIVPASQSNRRLWEILREYRRRKRVGKMFCGGIVNYSFIDNWLSGCLYFFAFKAKFKRKERVKFCTDVVRWVKDQEMFYYRSCSYDPTKSGDAEKWGHEFTPPNQTLYSVRRINRPTTFVDLGPRDEFIKEICLDPALDPNCSISRNIGATSFQDFGELLGLAINYRMDVSDNEMDINGFFDNGGFIKKSSFSRVLDGDILQLISINNEVGIEPFDLQNPKYLGYSYQYLDPEIYPNVFKNGHNVFGPLPVTFDLSDDGERIRLCLNEPTHIDYSGNTVQGRLTESSQIVPFYLWDKKGTGFGPYNINELDDQSWDYENVHTQPLQGMTFKYNITGPPNDSSDKYLLLPMTYTFSGLTIETKSNTTTEIPFDIVETGETSNHRFYDSEYPGFQYLWVTEGTVINPQKGFLYTRYGPVKMVPDYGWHEIEWNNKLDFIIKKTQDYYDGQKQILSTPFLFYFGLRPGETGLDKFIERFGPSGAFPSAE